MVSITTCRNCGGNGEIIENFCTECKGRGKTLITERLEIEIPPGVDTGTRLRISGKGEYHDGMRGDLYVYITVKPHKIFERDGNDIYQSITISYVQAALGCDIEIPTLNGAMMVRIPQGTQPGDIIKISGKGIIDINRRNKGNMYVKINVSIPKKLTSQQRKLLEELAKLNGIERKRRFRFICA
jgi:molecular chaperone DnaJ